MEHTKVIIDQDGTGQIQLYSEGHNAGLMEIAINGTVLSVFHTEVFRQYEGKGFAKILLGALVDLAKQKGLKINPLCPYVHMQFKRHASEYRDIWFRRITP